MHLSMMVRLCPSTNGPFAQFLRQAQILILEILQCIPVVKIFAFLELAQNCSFVDGHKIGFTERYTRNKE
jgi:hypothetical protein